MQNISTAFKRELNKDNRNYIKSCTIALVNGENLSITNDQIWNNGFVVEDAVSSDNSFDIGAAIVGKLTLSLNNIYDDFSDYDFSGATVTNARVGIRLPDGTIESVKKGIFTVDEAKYNGSIITLECLDNMLNFDRPYSISKLAYPATLGAIIRDACSCCDVSLAADSAYFENNDFVVDARPDDKSLTFRQVLSWVGQISCHWLKCNVNGQLSLGWYDVESYEAYNSIIDAGDIKNPAGDVIDAGTFANPASDIVDVGTFGDRNAFHHIYSMSSMNISTDDVVITGVRVTEEAPKETGSLAEDEAEASKEDTVYQYGQDGYVLGIEGNKLIQGGKGSDVASYLGTKLVGLRFRPFSVSCLSDPSIESGDLALISDRKGHTYATLITNTTFSAGNYQSVSCGAETPGRKNASRFSEATRVYNELRQKLNRNKSEWVKAMEQLAERLNNSSGLFTTETVMEDGSRIFYMHDKPKLEESMIIWKMTAEAWGVSTDGGKTWNGGMTVDGEMLTRILTTIGLNADWINTGALVIRDVDGNIIFNADVDTGRVDIVADSFSLKGRTLDEITQDKLNDFVNNVYVPDIEGIQNQIDGQVETFYYDYEPSLSNQPASGWVSDLDRQKHEGDLFFWREKGFAYRFMKNDGAWEWVLVKDTDITKALADAASAQDTADGKRRVFINTPIPPYDEGDLWAQGENGEILVCRTARATGSFSSADWTKSSKYTDDKALNDFIGGDFKNTIESLKEQNDKKVETWYQNANPSLKWTTDELKAEHTGDMWYNTADMRYYRWDGSQWTEMNVQPPEFVFNEINGKAQIFVAQPVVPYRKGDLWITESAGIKICINSRMDGSFAGGDWKDSKYVDISSVNDAIDIYDTSLGQTEVFNKLTGGGKKEGLWIENGKLIVNASYILAGVLAGKYINAKGISVKDNYNNTTFAVDDYGNVTIRCSSFSLFGNTIDNIAKEYADSAKTAAISAAASDATTKASSAFTSAKEYTDNALDNLDLDVSLSQEEIFNILTDDGKTKCIRMINGELYINATYIDTGELAGWEIDKTNKVIKCNAGGNTVELDAKNAWVYVKNYLSVFNGTQNRTMEGTYVEGDAVTTPKIDTFQVFTSGLRVYGTSEFEGEPSFGTHIRVAGNAYVTGGVLCNGSLIVTGSGITADNALIKSTKTYNTTGSTTDTAHLVVAANGQFKKANTSSKRYKDHVGYLSKEEAEKLYGVPIVKYTYKPGVFTDDDPGKDVVYVGAYAEDMCEAAPDCIQYDKGLIENWDEKGIVARLVKLAQEQHKTIQSLTEQVNSLEERISRLEGGGKNGNQ